MKTPVLYTGFRGSSPLLPTMIQPCHRCNGSMKPYPAFLCSRCGGMKKNGFEEEWIGDMPEPIKTFQVPGFDGAPETLTTRIIYVADCKCGEKFVRLVDPPREIQCDNCKEWLTFKKVEWTGKDRFR